MDKDTDSIPAFEDTDKLFYHVARNSFKPNYDFDDIPYHVFTPQGNSLSTNWDKFCKSAEECLAIKTDKYPDGRTSKTHGVGHFIVKDIKEIKLLELKYTPSKSSNSHCGIYNIPTAPKEPFNEMRMKLRRIFNFWDIRPETEEINPR